LSQNLHIAAAILEIHGALVGSAISNCVGSVMSDKQKKKIKSLKKEVKELKSQLKKFKLAAAVKKTSKLTKSAGSAPKAPVPAPTLVSKPDKPADATARR
jgi:hypothetical protein